MKERSGNLSPLPGAAAVSCQQQYSLSLLMLSLKLYVSLTLLLTRQNKLQRRYDQSRYHWFGCGCLWSTWYEFSFQDEEFHKVFINVSRMRTMNSKEREGGEQRSDWLQGIRPNGNQRLWDVRTTIDLYFTCSPEICHTYTHSEQNKRGGREKVWAQSHRSNGARGLVKEAYKDE